MIVILLLLIPLLSPSGQSNRDETNFNLCLLLHLLVFHTCWEVRCSCAHSPCVLLHYIPEILFAVDSLLLKVICALKENTTLSEAFFLLVLLYVCQGMGLSRAKYELDLSSDVWVGGGSRIAMLSFKSCLEEIQLSLGRGQLQYFTFELVPALRSCLICGHRIAGEANSGPSKGAVFSASPPGWHLDLQVSCSSRLQPSQPNANCTCSHA